MFPTLPHGESVWHYFHATPANPQGGFDPPPAGGGSVDFDNMKPRYGERGFTSDLTDDTVIVSL